VAGAQFYWRCVVIQEDRAKGSLLGFVLRIFRRAEPVPDVSLEASCLCDRMVAIATG